MNLEIKNSFKAMIGGNEGRFFREYWRSRTFFVKSALPQLVGFYDFSSFLRDYQAVGYHDATLLVSVDDRLNRKMQRLTNDDSIGKALARGESLAVQALLVPDNLLRRVMKWEWFVNLHRALCEYLLPEFPSSVPPGGPVAAVDIFCTRSDTSTGGHYDTGDVFYFVLEGEKEWTVAAKPDLDQGILSDRTRKCDLGPSGDCMLIRVQPGDCLYVPPYTYHRVCSHSNSLAVSLGIPTYNEVSVLTAFLFDIRSHIYDQDAFHKPLPSYPRDEKSLFALAHDETRSRLQAALGMLAERMEALATGAFSPSTLHNNLK
jgi:ribosomal protein L16 Arg81 hydroxylase